MKVQKIKKKKPFINPNAGNVEKGIQFFNNAAGNQTAVGEDLEQVLEVSDIFKKWDPENNCFIIQKSDLDDWEY